MVLHHRQHAVTQPTGQRLGQLRTPRRVPLDHRELLLGQLPRLVEDLRRHPQLPDVVDQRRPPQAVELGRAQPHLLTDHLGVRAHPLGVPTRDPVVAAERRHQIEQVFRRGRDARLTAAGVPLDPLLQLHVRRAVAERHPVPRRRLVREHQGEVEQGRERQEATHQPVGEAEDHHRHRADRDDTRHEPRRRVGGRQHLRQRIRGGHARRERDEHHDHPDEARQPRTTLPAPGRVGLRRPPGFGAVSRRGGVRSTHVRWSSGAYVASLSVNARCSAGSLGDTRDGSGPPGTPRRAGDR
ncbi:unannotated protein [freshwater metagenome]|uniref:Unannotated protein n=1 Tax=freshwater metagenome TaxID=449393 RepID=A0A6J6GY75_9ZZZZ